MQLQYSKKITEIKSNIPLNYSIITQNQDQSSVFDNIFSEKKMVDLAFNPFSDESQQKFLLFFKTAEIERILQETNEPIYIDVSYKEVPGAVAEEETDSTTDTNNTVTSTEEQQSSEVKESEGKTETEENKDNDTQTTTPIADDKKRKVSGTSVTIIVLLIIIIILLIAFMVYKAKTKQMKNVEFTEQRISEKPKLNLEKNKMDAIEEDEVGEHERTFDHGSDKWDQRPTKSSDYKIGS